MSEHETEKTQQMRQLRDAKVWPHLDQYAPVWLINERILAQEESIFFDVVFCHPQYRWIIRRYRYDAYDNILYYFGQQTIREDQALDYQEQTPYIPAETINTLNSYGG